VFLGEEIGWEKRKFLCGHLANRSEPRPWLVISEASGAEWRGQEWCGSLPSSNPEKQLHSSSMENSELALPLKSSKLYHNISGLGRPLRMWKRLLGSPAS